MKVQKENGGSIRIDALVSVTVLIFPSGRTHWFETKPVYKDLPDENHAYLVKCFDIWKKRNKEKYKDYDVTSAVANIRMLKNDFDKIPVTADFIE